MLDGIQSPRQRQWVMLTYGCNVEVTEMHGVDVVKGHIVYSIEFPKGSEVNNGEPFREPIVSEERRPSTVEPAMSVRVD
jgi:hypothetical protein